MLKGISGSSGYGIGKVSVYRVFDPTVSEQLVALPERAEQASLFGSASNAAAEELHMLVRTLSANKGAIFAAHLEMLEDEAIREEIVDMIRAGASAEWAVYCTYQVYIESMQALANEVMRERAADLADVRNRILRNLRGEPERSLASQTEPAIVAARDILPSDVARLDQTMVLAFLTETGGATSHAAILARACGIPAVLGITGLLETLRDGQTVVVDGAGGVVLTDPDDETLAEYRARQDAFLREAAISRACLPLQARTQDGVMIQTSLNIGSSELPETEAFADGVGLFRSEFLYMERSALPGEETQYAAYLSVLRRMGKRPVILRTLDIGGDKTLPYLPLAQEENPFLGKRAIRLCFELEAVFRTQLRAAYHAASEGNLWIMFPMIGSVEEFRRAKEIACCERNALLCEGLDVPEVPLGVMIEIPSAALTADLLAREVDFASIGTNDLCQYTFAADRMNPAVSQYARPLSAAMLRLMRMCADAFLAQGKPLSVCGELAGEPRAIPLLLGCGIQKLSMSDAALGGAKRVIRACTGTACEQLASLAQQTALESDVVALADAFLRDLGIECFSG